MKKSVYLLFLLILFYTAGMYGSSALMVMFLVQFFLAAAMLVLSRHLGKHLGIRFAERTVFAEQGIPFSLKLCADNSCRLPAGRVLVKTECRQSKEKRKGKMIFAGCDTGETVLSKEMHMEHCGIAEMHLVRIRVFDYLSLFSYSGSLDARCRIIVFPRTIPIRIETGAFPPENRERDSEAFAESGMDLEEIRQIREYREGDSMRHIHWNQTAKSGTIWVKEYEGESEVRADLILDMGEKESGSVLDMDRFYMLLSGLLDGLLRCTDSVCVYIRGGKESGKILVKNSSQCGKIFLYLYQMREGSQPGYDMEAGNGALPPYRDHVLRLTPDLELYCGESLVHRFSKEDLESEMSRTVLYL